MADRPLFDPARVRVPESERLRRDVPDSSGAGGPALVSPRQVNELVRGAIRAHLPATLHVLGEIGDLSRPTSGHYYFSLKDASSELRCVMWRSAAAGLRFSLAPGLEVIATGGIEVYAPRGGYQLVVRRIEPRGVGALELAFRQLREKLQLEGLFDAARKRPLPAFPRRIALVTSPRGAALRDILHTLERRFPLLDIVVFPTRVQGEGAAEEIAAAIAAANRVAERLGGLDVLIVARGGGSLEDLWAFNEERVARAIAASSIPVVSAVGHEMDVSISDLVADLRAATPTAAAELIAPRLSDVLAALARCEQRAGRALRQQLDAWRARLHERAAASVLAQPLVALREQAQRLDDAQHRIEQGWRAALLEARQRLRRSDGAILRFGSGAAFSRLVQRLDRCAYRLGGAWSERWASGSRALQAAHARLILASPTRRVGELHERLRLAERVLGSALSGLVRRERGRLAARLDVLAACDPQHVLRRGYSLTRDAKTRRLIRSIAEVREGQRVITEVADGEFRSTAEDPRQARLFD